MLLGLVNELLGCPGDRVWEGATPPWLVLVFVAPKGPQRDPAGCAEKEGSGDCPRKPGSRRPLACWVGGSNVCTDGKLDTGLSGCHTMGRVGEEGGLSH